MLIPFPHFQKHKSYAALALVAGLSAQVPISHADVRFVDLVTNDLIYNPVDEKIYASIPGSAGPDGNSIVTIDPVTGAVGPSVYVGSEPDELALSDDGQYLYIDLSGSASVVPYHIPTQTLLPQIILGNDPNFGPLYAEDIEVQPGNPDVIAVSLVRLGVSPRHGGVAVFDNGVKLPTTTPDHTGSNVIEFGFVPDILYGYNNETTEYGFRTMAIDANGISVIETTETAITNFYTNIEFHDGVMYSTNGVAIDPDSGNTLGTFASVSSADSVAIDSGQDKVYFLDSGQIQTYQKSTFILEDTTFYGGSVTNDLVLWGTSGLAYRADDQVVLISEEPPTRLDIYPVSGEFLNTQDFDLGLVITAPSAIADFTASIGNTSLDRAMRSCVFGESDMFQQTIRCPDFSRPIIRHLGNGPHVLDVVVDLEDATQLEATVTWEFIPTSELQ